jgi:CubicO group peptidase (beta-lactamase class C family)
MFRIAVLLCVLGGSARADWIKSPPEAEGLSASKLREMEGDVRAGEFKKITSIAIARNGKLVYEAYFDGDATTLRDTRSVGKTVTSMLVGLAIAERKLSGVDARILALLPERTRRIANLDPRKLKITVEDFLTMSGPLECDDWNDFSRGNEERMYLVEDWTQFILDLPIRGWGRDSANEEPPEYGRRFSYCTGGVFVLGEVLGRVTNVPLERYAQDRLFTPLGITRAQWAYSPKGQAMAGGMLRLSTRDFLRLAQLYLDDGVHEGKQLVDSAWVKRSLEPKVRIDEATEYGYLWWLKAFGPKRIAAFWMSGNGGNKVMAFPSLDLTVVITSTNYATRGMHEQTEKLVVDYILPAVVR